ncbi:hypothetical protein N9B12_01630, partial [bacterium]|nr:hypothetical protein [bacterium]
FDLAGNPTPFFQLFLVMFGSLKGVFHPPLTVAWGGFSPRFRLNISLDFLKNVLRIRSARGFSCPIRHGCRNRTNRGNYRAVNSSENNPTR